MPSNMEQLKCLDVSINENFIVLAYKKPTENATHLAIFEIISERLLACSLLNSEFILFLLVFLYLSKVFYKLSDSKQKKVTNFEL